MSSAKEYYKEQSYTWQSNRDELFENALRILFNSAIDALGPLDSNQVILDIGCGSGDFLDYYTKNARYIGIDISPENIAEAQKKHPNAQFLVGDATQLSLEDHSIDAIVCIETIEHLTIDEIRTLLKEMKRLLKSGGRVVVTTPNLFYIWGVIPWSFFPVRRRLSIAKFLKGLKHGYVDENYNLPVHHYRFRPSFLRDLAAEYFLVESIRSTYWYNNRAIHHIWPALQMGIMNFSARHRFLWTNGGSQLVLALVNGKKD